MCAAKKKKDHGLFGMGKFANKEPQTGLQNAGYEFAPEIVPAGDGLVTSRNADAPTAAARKEAGDQDGV